MTILRITNILFTILALFFFSCENKSINISLTRDIIIKENSIKIENTDLTNPFVINKFIKVLGEYSFKESLINDAYTWDNHGIKILCPNYSNIAIEINFIFKKSEIGSNPKNIFMKNIVIDSLSINKNTKPKNLQNFGFKDPLSFELILSRYYGVFKINAFRDPESNELNSIAINLINDSK